MARQRMLAQVIATIIITATIVLAFLILRYTTRKASEELRAMKECLLMIPSSIVNNEAVLRRCLLSDKLAHDTEMQMKMRQSELMYQQILQDTDRAIVCTDARVCLFFLHT